MHYLSTRGGVEPIPFTKAMMMGLGSDGGLLLPRAIPRIDRSTFESWQELSYEQLAFEVMSRFIDDIPAVALKEMIHASYTSFTHKEITPLVHLDDMHILELFHGPTFAFKDIALQFLGNLFEYILNRDDLTINILGATSGDTGSAAIAGVRGKERINIFILYPHNRISPIQEKQMTTVTDANVFNIAVKGTFDDAQAIVKDVFGDIDFKTAFRLGAINSINWARVLAQVVYFIYSCLHLSSHEKDRATSFSVPTGNFGDIFAGFIAKKMLPEGSINTLLLATNANDILARFVNEGDYSRGKVIATSSPSMDIQAASNFERYLYYLYDSDPARVKDSMERFKQEGKLDLTSELDNIKRDFTAVSVSEDEIRKTIARYYNQHNYILDPHTAVGVYAALKHRKKGIPMVCLATAHPAKFGESVQMAIDKQPDLPEALSSIINKPSRCVVINADKKEIMTFITKNAIK